MNDNRYKLEDDTIAEMYMCSHGTKLNIIKAYPKRSYVIIEKDKNRAVSLIIETIKEAFNSTSNITDGKSNFIEEHDLERIANNIYFIIVLNLGHFGFMRLFLSNYILKIFSADMAKAIYSRLDYLATYIFHKDLGDDLNSAVFFIEDVLIGKHKSDPLTIVALKY